MRYPPDLLDEIRARIPVSQVVERKVKLKRHGREFTGLSPFKQEKTPSFTVNDHKGFYHCFATGEHGDIFTFLMKTEGLAFPEAVEQLAQQAGVDLPKPSPQAEAREAIAVTLKKITEASCQFFQNALASEDGREARDYLERRGLGRDHIEHFRLGYAPAGRHRLKEHLAARGVKPEHMAISGMLIAGDDIPVSYDRFRHRLTFPIPNLRGEVIAFGGRALADDQQPKYLNSPETPLFHKGTVLFNAASARKAAHERGGVIVAEGYMDVIAFARAGFHNAVAPLGTALTPEQISLLWRMADEPLLCFDGDAAGIKAAHRAVETVLPHLKPGKSLSFVFLPEGMDPDDLLRDRGPDAVAEALKAAQPLVNVLWSKELNADEWTTPERRAQFEERINALVETIADKTVRQYYSRDMRKRLWDHFRNAKQPYNNSYNNAPNQPRRQRGFRDGGAGSRPAGGGKRSQPVLPLGPTDALTASAIVSNLAPQDDMPHREVLLIRMLINHPWLLDDYAEEISLLQFTSTMLQNLLSGVFTAYGDENPLDNQALRHQLEKMGYSEVLTRIEHAITHKSDRDTQPDASRDDVLIGWRQRLALHRKWELERELESALRAYTMEPSEENFLKLQDLNRQVCDKDGLEVSADN